MVGRGQSEEGGGGGGGGGGGRPNLMLAQVPVFCPGPCPGQDLTGT